MTIYSTTMVVIMLQKTAFNTVIRLSYNTPYKYFFPKLYSLVYFIKN